jgi:hypothetical protein
LHCPATEAQGVDSFAGPEAQLIGIRLSRLSSLMSCTASGEHVFVCQAIHAVLLEQIVNCLAKQVLHRYVEIHCQFPKLSTHLH